MHLVFCSKCGAEVAEEAYFCPRCGFRTRKGVEVGIAAPMEDMREAFASMEKELERAFTTAAKEMHKAFKTVRESVKEKSFTSQIVCTSCGEKNPSGVSFCYKCGKKID
jgi:ribosomal protein L40E